MRDAAVAAGLLVGGRRDLDGAGEVRARSARNASTATIAAASPPFMSQAAAAVDPAVDQRAAERVGGPALPDLDHVDMAVEVHARPRPRALAPRHQVPARIAVAVARRRPRRARTRSRSPARASRSADQLADLAVVLAGRVHRRHPHQRLGQRDQLLAPLLDRPPQRLAASRILPGPSFRRDPRLVQPAVAHASPGPRRSRPTALLHAQQSCEAPDRINRVIIILRPCCTAAAISPAAGPAAL